MKKVLIIAAEGDWHDTWFSELGPRVGLDGEIALVSATSAREAEEQFDGNPDFAAIVVAVCDEESPVTGSLVSLVRSFRDADFMGPMIAVGDKEHRRQLVRAGCNHEASMHALPDKLVEVLGL